MEVDKMRKKFYLIGIIGVVLISILSFIIPKNPYETIPAITIFSFDKPLWLCLLISGNFIFLSILYGLYELTKK